MSQSVKVVPYDDDWIKSFEKEAILIKSVLGANCVDIHHIGSTAVPGLGAKPIIDILPVVRNILQVDDCVPAMEALGYISRGENGMPFRRFFQKGINPKTHHVHIFEQGSSEITRHIKFRDWMRSHPNDREAYGKLKVELAAKYPNDIFNYCLGKDDFVADIDAKAGFDGRRMVAALTNHEWEAVQNFRQKYFFDRVPINDPYTWTFNNPQHVHFVLYQGTKIVGYSHLQLWPQNRAAMRIIVIDEYCRNKGLGSELLKLCERWLSHKNIKKLLVQSSPDAYNFYRKHGYIEMPFEDPDGYEGDLRDIEVGKNLI